MAAFTLFAPPSTPGPTERDFEAYYAAGVTVDSGGDPYSRAVWEAERHIPGVRADRDELLPFVGPAAALPLWSLLGRMPYRAALVVWTTILITAVLVLLSCALRLARVPRDARLLVFAAAFAIASAPLIASLALGQAALVAAAGVAAAIVTYRARTVPLAITATLAAAIQPNLALALIGRIRSVWDGTVASAAAAVFGVVTLAAGGGIVGWQAYLHHLAAHGGAERFIAIQHTPAAIGYALGLQPATAITVSELVALVVLIATGVVMVRERLDATTAALLACAALPLVVPFFHEPDFVIELLPILILALRATARPRILASVAAVLILIDWFGLAQRHGAQAQILCLGLATAFAFIGMAPPTARRDLAAYTGLAALVVIAALAVPLALAHPAPTWPDNLPDTFAASPSADAAAVWGAEQRAAGLAIVQPVWGVLRALPLMGCLVLACALVADARRRRRERTNLRDELRLDHAPAGQP